MSEGLLHVEELGSLDGRAPLFLLHGWAHSGDALRPLGELLSTAVPVRVVDLPGFGRSDPPGQDWGVRQYAERIKRYLDEVGIKKASFLGHSFGGKVSAMFASLYPDRVERLILLNASVLKPIRPPKQRLRYFFVRTLGKTLKLLHRLFKVRWYFDWFIPRFASADYKSAGELRTVFVRIVNEDLASEASRITAPTLLLWGERDPETRIEIARRLATLIRGSTLLVLPYRGHEPFRNTGAHLIAYYVRAFLLNGSLPQTRPGDWQREAGHA